MLSVKACLELPGLVRIPHESVTVIHVAQIERAAGEQGHRSRLHRVQEDDRHDAGHLLRAYNIQDCRGAPVYPDADAFFSEGLEDFAFGGFPQEGEIEVVDAAIRV